VTARCVELRDKRLTCECTAVDGSGRALGRGTTVQAVLPHDVLEARIGNQARDRGPARS
jgi:fluoroacetyl-CoA thioesterase